MSVLCVNQIHVTCLDFEIKLDLYNGYFPLLYSKPLRHLLRSQIDAASTTIKIWLRQSGPIVDQTWGISMSVVWSGWDLLGREVSRSPHAYFEHI